MSRASRWLIVSALAVLVAGAVFTSAAGIIWPQHEPVWVIRVSSAGLAAGTLLTAVGATLWILSRGRS